MDRIEVAKGLTSKTPEELQKRFGKAANLQKKRRLAAKLTIPLSFLGVIASLGMAYHFIRRDEPFRILRSLVLALLCFQHALTTSGAIQQSKNREAFLRRCKNHSSQLHALLTNKEPQKTHHFQDLQFLKKKIITSEIAGSATQFAVSLGWLMQYFCWKFSHLHFDDNNPASHQADIAHIFFTPMLIPLIFYGIKPIITASSRRRNKLPNLTMIFSKHIRKTNFNIKKEAYLEELANRFPSYMKKDAVAA